MDLFAALGLVFIIEGILPFLRPDSARRLFTAASQLDAAVLRGIGFCSMCLGLLILYIAR
jgi:uncharacterized protein